MKMCNKNKKLETLYKNLDIHGMRDIQCLELDIIKINYYDDLISRCK
jgi:hypothetical protein